MSILKVENVTKTYGTGHTTVHAVNRISLNVEKGEIVLIIGPSGSGKTTLLSMMGTLLTPASGKIVIAGSDITQLSERQLPQFRLQKIGFIFQSFNLLSALSAVQNVAVPLIAAGKGRRDAYRTAKNMLKRFGLEKRKHHLPEDLSGGEKQRVAIARALANEPQLILADEPTANLDSKIGHEITSTLCEIACQEKRAVIIVSHDPRLEDIAKRIYTIEDGRLTNERPGGHDRICKMRH